MTRVKRGIVIKKRHKRLLKQTKGYWGQRSNIFKRAKETLLRAMAFAFKGRKMKKRSMRGLFIMRIKAAAEKNGAKYNTMMHGLKQENIELNRKMLAQLAVYDPQVFGQLVEIAQAK
jgi:large subunit ribosomal protein L20